jgi:hypothetical protein
MRSRDKSVQAPVPTTSTLNIFNSPEDEIPEPRRCVVTSLDAERSHNGDKRACFWREAESSKVPPSPAATLARYGRLHAAGQYLPTPKAPLDLCKKRSANGPWRSQPKRLNEQVRPNRERFPAEFIFQLAEVSIYVVRALMAQRPQLTFATITNGRFRVSNLACCHQAQCIGCGCRDSVGWVISRSGFQCASLLRINNFDIMRI